MAKDILSTMKSNYGVRQLRMMATAILIAISASFSAAQTGRQAACDRACLNKLVDTYLAAVVAHDPARAPLAADVKFVENTVPLKPG